MAIQVWHDEVQRLERTGRLDQGPCWCPECVEAELAAANEEGASPSGFLAAGLPHTSGDADPEHEDARQPEREPEAARERVIHPPRDDEHEQGQEADE